MSWFEIPNQPSETIAASDGNPVGRSIVRKKYSSVLGSCTNASTGHFSCQKDSLKALGSRSKTITKSRSDVDVPSPRTSEPARNTTGAFAYLPRLIFSVMFVNSSSIRVAVNVLDSNSASFFKVTSTSCLSLQKRSLSRFTQEHVKQLVKKIVQQHHCDSPTAHGMCVT